MDFRSTSTDANGRDVIGAFSRGMADKVGADPIYPSNGEHITGSIYETFAESVAAYAYGDRLPGYDPRFLGSARYNSIVDLFGRIGR
jgi:hypothetical protein